MVKFNVMDFRFANDNDEYDLEYTQDGAWSRIYEYRYVTDFINEHKFKDFSIPEIHNSSWGFEGIHVKFRDNLDKIGKCIHSDIGKSNFRETFYYDITKEHEEFENKFDFVLNISTIEHLSTIEERLVSIENLFKQVKPNGYLILTFDFPRVNLSEIEELVKCSCEKTKYVLNGQNSINQNLKYSDLNIIYLILKKNE